MTQQQYSLSIWPTDGCNSYGKCKYCFYKESELWDISKAQMMKDNVIDAIVNRMNSGGVTQISLFGGEPTLNWHACERILKESKLPEIIKGRGYVHNITTNGSLLTPKRINFLAAHKVFISLSFDGTKETQDYWRGDNYDKIIKNLDMLVKYPGIQILKTVADPTKLYEDVAHIKELGFKAVFLNLLDPYSHITYEGYDVNDFKKQYRKVVIELHGNGFQVADYGRWLSLIKQENKGFGCGFTNKGLCVDWEGRLWPCHQGPSLPKEFSIGNIWDGICREKEKQIRSVSGAPSCNECGYRLSKCWVSMYNKHGKFEVDPPQWHRDFELAKISVIEELNHLQPKQAKCRAPSWNQPLEKNSVDSTEDRLLLATLISQEKYFLLKPFFESIQGLELPWQTDYYVIIDDDAKRLNHVLGLWGEGKSPWLPDPREKFGKVRIMKIPTVKDEGYMFRIARGRNMVLGVARKDPRYKAYAFIDADMIIPSDTLVKLDSVDAGIVGALVKCRRDDREGWFNNYVKTGKGYESVKDFKPGEILDVTATGSDCLIIRREVFMGQTYAYKPEIPEAEDFGFCFKAAERGFKIKIHTGASTKHITIKDVKIE